MRVNLKSNPFPGKGDSGLEELLRAGHGWWRENACAPLCQGPKLMTGCLQTQT